MTSSLFFPFLCPKLCANAAVLLLMQDNCFSWLLDWYHNYNHNHPAFSKLFGVGCGYSFAHFSYLGLWCSVIGRPSAWMTTAPCKSMFYAFLNHAMIPHFSASYIWTNLSLCLGWWHLSSYSSFFLLLIMGACHPMWMESFSDFWISVDSLHW